MSSYYDTSYAVPKAVIRTSRRRMAVTSILSRFPVADCYVC